MTPPQNPPRKNHILATAEQAKESRKAAKQQQSTATLPHEQQGDNRGDAFGRVGLREAPKTQRREISQL